MCVLSERYGRMCSVMEWQLTTGGLPGVELCGAWREIVERRTDHGHGETVCGAVFRIRSNNKKASTRTEHARAKHKTRRLSDTCAGGDALRSASLSGLPTHTTHCLITRALHSLLQNTPHTTRHTSSPKFHSGRKADGLLQDLLASKLR